MARTQPSSGESEAQRAPRRRWVVLSLSAGLWGLCGLWLWRPPSQANVEALYSRTLYRWIEGLLMPLTASLPFSLALILIAAVLTGFPLLWLGNWLYLRRIKRRAHWRGLWWGIKWGILLAPVVMVWFLVVWGAGYARVPIEKRLELDEAGLTQEEAARLRGALLAVVERDLPGAEGRDVARALAAVSKALELTVEAWDGKPITLPATVKATPKGLLLVNGTSGFCSPLTLEPHVDGGLPDTAFVYTAAHELAHIAGICGEAEADCAGFVAGLAAEDPFARYAVALRMYADLAGTLPSGERKAAFARLPQAAQDDLGRAAEAAKKYRIDWFSRLSWRAYDRYLRSQGVVEGVRDYDRGMRLFASLWRQGLARVPDGSRPGRTSS